MIDNNLNLCYIIFDPKNNYSHKEVRCLPKSFSEQEKTNIKNTLIDSCKTSWKKYGYKRTSVDELCEKAGISKGAFYIFFKSKEHLFYETVIDVQHNLYALIEETLSEEQSKTGVAKALKLIYAEYDRSPFLYDTSSVDFTSFMNKLSDEEKQNIYFDSLAGAKHMLDKPFLTLRISEEKALTVLSALLNIVVNKEKMICNHFEVFDFMLDNLIDKIFE